MYCVVLLWLYIIIIDIRVSCFVVLIYIVCYFYTVYCVVLLWLYIIIIDVRVSCFVVLIYCLVCLYIIIMLYTIGC